MKDHATDLVSDSAFAKRHERWPEETPDTKEAYFIREIFDRESALKKKYSFRKLTRCLGHFPTPSAAQTAVRYAIFMLFFRWHP